MRYFGHDASAMSATEAARIAAVLPLPKKRGAIAPKGFTRSYGNTIAARIGQVRRDGLDACVYEGSTAPKDKTPPPSKAQRELPGTEYETATPPPPEPDVDASEINVTASDETGSSITEPAEDDPASAATNVEASAEPEEPVQQEEPQPF
jgi:monofunctional biosynthetic peptidoglycan transglycosylase